MLPSFYSTHQSMLLKYKLLLLLLGISTLAFSSAVDPTAPRSVQVKQVVASSSTTVSATISWSVAKTPSTDMTWALNCVREDEERGASRCNAPGVLLDGLMPSTRQATIGDLEKNTKYQCWVQARSSDSVVCSKESVEIGYFYYAENGITMLCPEAKVGDWQVMDSAMWIKLDRPWLNALVTGGEKVWESFSTTCISGVNDTSLLFRNVNFNGDIQSWDTSSVVMMQDMFEFNEAFNQDISAWDTSAAQKMNGMFRGAVSFNQDLSSWNVAAVQDFGAMFLDAPAFNGNITTWNTESAETMRSMFLRATSFNQDISSWNVQSVKNFHTMFDRADSFDQPIGSWDTSGATSMQGMFNNAMKFNQDISGWNTSSVTTMKNMFIKAQSFNQDLSVWNVASVTDCAGFSRDATNWTLPKPSFVQCTV